MSKSNVITVVKRADIEALPSVRKEIHQLKIIQLVHIFITLLIIGWLCSGCAALKPDHTIFLKEENNVRLFNLSGENCSESGYQIRKAGEGKYNLIVYYSNCDVHQSRGLREFELKQWVLPKEGDTNAPKSR